MENVEPELVFEKQRLKQTIALAEKQLLQARQGNENNKEAIASAKQELRENTQHSISDLWGSEGFEALAALSQYVNPIIVKVAEYEATESKILRLEQLIQSPYFARVDFKFDDEDDFEKIYIGRSSLMKEGSYEMYVYDWRSPIASVFYRFMLGRAFYEAPNGKITGEVNLKRQYEINKGTLEYYFDADIQIVDEFLRKMLSQNTSSKMKTIVETIQKEQDIIIRDMENDLMMVQGVAGSGKTSIALHRAAYLMYQGLSSKLSSDNIMIVSPSSLFEQYISDVLPELGEDNVVSFVFDDLLNTILKGRRLQPRNQFLESLIRNSQYRDIIKSSIEFKTSRQFMEILDRFISDLPHRWIEFDNVYFNGNCIVSKERLKDRILSGRKDTPLCLRLQQLEDFVLDAATGEKRRSSSQTNLLKREIQKFTIINVEELYQKLINDRKYFYSLAEDMELPENINEILDFTRDNLSDKYLYYDDAAVLAYMKLKLNRFNKYRNIKQVVIDEAQDYYPLHFEIFSMLFSNAKYTILGDINQTLEKQEDLSLYEQIAKALNKKKSSLITMDKSFRCTNEILTFSSKFVNNNIEIKSFNRSGDEPIIHTADDMAAVCDMIVSEVTACLEKEYRSIGLICKTEKNARSFYEHLKRGIDMRLIKNGSKAELHGVFVLPVYMSKGLEFDAVLICDANNENYNSEDDKKLLYIACTRALHRLSLFSEGEASSLI